MSTASSKDVAVHNAVSPSIATLAAGLLAGVATRVSLDAISVATLESIATKAILLDTILTTKAR